MKARRERTTGDIRPLETKAGIGPGRPQMLREVNVRELLRLLRLHSPCSRADLVRQSGLSAPTVSSGIAFLERKGLVEPVGPALSNGGRPASLLKFNSKHGYVVGVDIGGAVVRVAFADLNGTVIGKWVATLRASRSPDAIAKLVATGIKSLKKHHKIRSERILALAAGAPGITDVRAGIVVSAPNLSNWQSVPLRAILEKHTGIPTAIENDVNLGALGESWCGTARGVKNFVFLAIGTGVGAGIFINGTLYHGSNWSAGEVGYLHVPGTEDTSLQLYRPGPLEGIVAGRGIEASWRTLCQENGVRIKKSRTRIRATDIFELAEAGEPEARVVLAQTSRILASAIANISVLLNSSLILLGGGIGTHPVLFEATRQVLERDEFARPRLAVSSLGPDAQLMGAVWMALKSVESRILP